MVDTELKCILLKSGSENLHGQVIVVQSKKGNRKIKWFSEYTKNSLIMNFFLLSPPLKKGFQVILLKG